MANTYNYPSQQNNQQLNEMQQHYLASLQERELLLHRGRQMEQLIGVTKETGKAGFWSMLGGVGASVLSGGLF